MAGVSQSSVSRIERGELRELSVETVRAIAARLEVRLEFTARWRGGDLERMANARHGRLAEVVIAWLRTQGWDARPEISFAIWGERGIVDVLAWNADHGALLVIELKTDIVDVGELLGTLDRKRRLGREIGQEAGWRARSVGVCLIVAEGRTNRRRIEAHRVTFDAALPDDGRRLRAWLREPVGPLAALRFVPDSHPGSGRTSMATPRRVSARKRRAS